MQSGRSSEHVHSSAPAAKAAREVVGIFKKFVRQPGLAIDPATVESREPPEPGIRCVHSHDRPLAFELVELCNSELGKDASDILKCGKKPTFFILNDPTIGIVKRKLGKVYQTGCPVDLLCYTDGLVVTPDDAILKAIRELVAIYGLGPFRQVWLWGERDYYLAAPSRS